VPYRCGKAPNQDAGAGKMIEQINALRAFEQAEQIGATEQPHSRVVEDAVEPPAIGGETRPGRGDPCGIAQRQCRDFASRTRHRPVAEQPAPGRRVRLADDHETDAQAGETEKLSKRAQHHDANG